MAIRGWGREVNTAHRPVKIQTTKQNRYSAIERLNWSGEMRKNWGRGVGSVVVKWGGSEMDIERKRERKRVLSIKLRLDETVCFHLLPSPFTSHLLFSSLPFPSLITLFSFVSSLHSSHYISTNIILSPLLSPFLFSYHILHFSSLLTCSKNADLTASHNEGYG